MMDMIKCPKALLEPDTKYSSKFSLGDEAVWLRIFDITTDCYSALICQV